MLSALQALVLQCSREEGLGYSRIETPPGNGRARLGCAGRKLGKRNEVCCWSRRKVIPRIEGSIRQARNACGLGRAWGEKLWRRKQACRDKLGLDNPEVWR